jgi:NitT/TauT family transport system substrate-binding protein
MEGEPMKKLCILLGLTAMLMLFGVLPWYASLSGQASAAEKVVFQFDWVPYGKYAGYYAAREKGFYKSVDLDVTFQRGYGGSTASVASGKFNYGIDAVAPIIVGRSKKLPVKLVSMWHERLMMVAYALKSSGIRTPKDLEGRKIGHAVGDSPSRTFPLFTEAVGIKKWNSVPLRPAAKNPSLLAKKVDAILTFATVGVVLKTKAKKMGDGIVELLFGDYGVRLPQDGIVANEKVMSEKPNQVRGFVAASLKGNAWAIEHPKEGVDIFMKYIPDASRAMTRGAWDLSSQYQVWGNLKKHGLGYIDRELMENARKLVSKTYKIANPPPVDEIYTTAFLPKELPRPKVPTM